jgi:hypothetical protein
VETGSHRAVVKRVGQGHQQHALMVRHVRAHDGDVLVRRQTSLGEVERFVKAVGAPTADRGNSRQVLGGGDRIEHRA